jgi:hypothetical protein
LNALAKIDIFPAALPALCTDVGQLIDDNVGKTFGRDVTKNFDKYLEDFDFVSNPKGKIAAKNKRMLMARFTNEVAGGFNVKHIALVEAAAMRTGFYLTIDESDLEKAVPVKCVCSHYSIIAFFLSSPSCLGSLRISARL